MSGILVNKLYDFKGHRDSVYALTENINKDQFYSGGGDGLVVRWDMNHPDQGDLIAKVPNSVYALHYLVDTHQLAIGHNRDGIHFVDVDNKKEVASIKLTSSAIFDIQAFENVLLVASGDGSIALVDRTTYSKLKVIKTSDKSVRCLAINPMTRELAAGYSDNYIRIFSLDDFSMKLEWAAHDNSVFTLQYTNENNYLISGSRDAKLKRWEVFKEYQKNSEVHAHLYPINNLAFSPDGKHFITCSLDKTIKVWVTETMQLLKVIDRARHGGHGTSVNKVLWLKDHRLVSASDDRNISIWNVHFE